MHAPEQAEQPPRGESEGAIQRPATKARAGAARHRLRRDEIVESNQRLPESQSPVPLAWTRPAWRPRQAHRCAPASRGTAPKGALLAFAETTAETGIKDAIRVTAINLRAMETDRLRPGIKRYAEGHGLAIDDAHRRLLHDMGVVRFGHADAAGAFLASSREEPTCTAASSIS